MSGNLPSGQRFSHVYIERGSPLRDSPRFRRRLAEYLRAHVAQGHQYSTDLNSAIGGALQRELGVTVPSHFGYDLAAFFERAELRDVLDAITIAYGAIGDQRLPHMAAAWLHDAARVLREENVGYSIDDKGGVHYSVDQAFEQVRASAVAALATAALSAASAAVDDAYRHLDGAPPDTKAAVRSMFEAVETIARLICPETRNLNRWLAENALKERCLAVMPQDKTEQTAAAELFESLGQWVDAMHNYRHGQATTEPVAPSESFAIYALSSGSAFARLLGECHQRLAQGA